MFKISFYAPLSHCDSVKNALFAAGAGKIGEYSCCSWQTLGEGQFLPLENSHPFIGEQGKIEKVPEYKVEMVCADEFIEGAINALKKSHPYETPAYQVIRIEDF